MSFREEEAIFRARISDARERMEASRVLMDYLREKALQLQHGQAVYQEKLDRSGSEDKESLERLLDIQRQAANAERELAQTREEMRAMESEYAMEQHRLTDLQKTTGQRFARSRG
jgi:chromosome segregation ATPase